MNPNSELHCPPTPYGKRAAAVDSALHHGSNEFEGVVVRAGIAKQIRSQGQRLSNKDSVQPNWGRVRATESDEYAHALHIVDVNIANILDLSESYAVVFSIPHPASGRPGSHRTSRRQRLRKGLQQQVLESSQQDASRGTVLERLEGFVHQMDASVAYVTLKTEQGEILYGEYAADELIAKGIGEHRRFRCETIETDGQVRVFLQAIPDKEVSTVEEAAINRRIDNLFADDQLDGDY